VGRYISGRVGKTPRLCSRLSQHLNTVDDTGSIKFTAEHKQDEQMPFLDTLIVRKTDGRVKLLVYTKDTYRPVPAFQFSPSATAQAKHG